LAIYVVFNKDYFGSPYLCRPFGARTAISCSHGAAGTSQSTGFSRTGTIRMPICVDNSNFAWSSSEKAIADLLRFSVSPSPIALPLSIIIAQRFEDFCCFESISAPFFARKSISPPLFAAISNRPTTERTIQEGEDEAPQ
jgi:hypothetical protein